jgi:Ca2+-binding EF-hand superfamily protein
LKYTETLKLLHQSKVDCRQFVNLKIVFLNEDQDGQGSMSEEHFRITIRKTIKKCEMQRELEDSLVACLKNDEGYVTYDRLCKLIEFYTYLFQPHKLKMKPT